MMNRFDCGPSGKSLSKFNKSWALPSIKIPFLMKYHNGYFNFVPITLFCLIFMKQYTYI